MAFTWKPAKQAVALVIGAAMLAGCTDIQTQETLKSAKPASNDTIDATVMHAKCKSDIVTTRKDSLVAERVRPGDPHYLEFRIRPSAAIPTGHMFVVYGDLDSKGKPRSFNYTGLYPKGNVAGLYAGIVLPVSVPGDMDPSLFDCNVMPTAAYRVSVSDEQYRRVLARIAQYRANPPKWRMLSFNCNHYAASLGVAAGMREPSGPRSMQFMSGPYFGSFVRANGDTINARQTPYQGRQD